ncbi:hypothetical protein MRX96_028155 [Rhipicephalus microplus]
MASRCLFAAKGEEERTQEGGAPTSAFRNCALAEQPPLSFSSSWSRLMRSRSITLSSTASPQVPASGRARGGQLRHPSGQRRNEEERGGEACLQTAAG